MAALVGACVLLALSCGAAIYFYRAAGRERDGRTAAEAEATRAHAALVQVQAVLRAAQIDADLATKGRASAEVDLQMVRRKAQDELHVVWTMLYEERARNAGEPAKPGAVLDALDRMLSGASLPGGTESSSDFGPVQHATITADAPTTAAPSPTSVQGTTRRS